MHPANLLDQESHFAFGENWLDYTTKITDSRIDQATADLQRLSGHQDLSDKSFLDIGCGSGLHALAAVRLGAKRIVCTDIDPNSIAAARQTLERFAPNSNYDVQRCSIFDMTAADLGTFDVVYSWGVLHHTGDMRRAITCAADLVAPNGEFYLALYQRTLFCGMWKWIKRKYSQSTPGQQLKMRHRYIQLRQWVAKLGGKDFDAYVAEYGKRRGMTFENDVHDWLGGYPYESISPRACHRLLKQLGFELDREFIGKQVRSVFGLFGSGCDEYAFRRASTNN